MDSPAGTLGYKAPEIYKHEEYSTKADMWSVGVLAYILYVKKYQKFFTEIRN
jgi:serine/threonine protein kinase